MKTNTLNAAVYFACFHFILQLISFESLAQTQQSTDCLNPTSITLCTNYEATIISETGNWTFNGTYLYNAVIFVNGHIAFDILEGSFATSGKEYFYKYTPSESGTYIFSAGPKGNPEPYPFDTYTQTHFKGFYKPSESGCNQNNWIDLGSYGDGVEEAISRDYLITLKAGIEYYFMIDFEVAIGGESYTAGFQLCKADPPVCNPSDPVTSCANTTANIPAGLGAWDFGGGFTGMNYTGDSTPGKEMIYNYTPASTGYYIVAAISANGKFDYLYKQANGTCDNTGWKEIATFNAPGEKVITEQLVQGVSYYFLIDNHSMEAGSQTFQICKAEATDCNAGTILSLCNAATINIATGLGAWDFAGTYPVNSVGTTSVGKEKFASFTPAVSANYSLEVTNATGGFINYLYKPATNGCNDSGWTGIGKFNAPTGKYIGFLQQGVTYYFVLDNVDNTIAASQTFKICPTPVPTCLPATNIGLYNPVSGTIPAGPGSWDNYPPDNLLASATEGKEIFFRFYPPATSKYSINQISGSPVKFYIKPGLNDCSNTGWQEMSLTGELQKGKPYLIVADQASIISNSIQFELIEAGEFLCPGASTVFCYFPDFGMDDYVFLSYNWYGPDTIAYSVNCIDLLNVPSSHYGYTYASEVIIRNMAYEFFIFNSPNYTLKFRTYWTGAISTDWHNPGNWSCNGVPDENTDVIIPNTANAPVIQTNVSVKKLFVLTGASVTVHTNVLLLVKD